MIRTLDASMLNIPYSAAELAPYAAKYGFKAISVPGNLMEDPALAAEADSVVKSYGLSWGLLPMPADFYHWDLDDERFASALEELRRRGEIAERLGIRHAYNHVWPTSFRGFDENMDWHIRRVRAVTAVLKNCGVHYGLEFLGPHELRRWQKNEFVHTLAGVLHIADAAGGDTGIAFDTFHWFTSSNGSIRDLELMESEAHRLVCVHLNDAVAGVPYDRQKDMERRLPMETGMIDSAAILRRFKKLSGDALYMIEPFEPARTRFHGMRAEEAVTAASDAMKKVEEQA